MCVQTSFVRPPLGSYPIPALLFYKDLVMSPPVKSLCPYHQRCCFAVIKLLHSFLKYFLSLFQRMQALLHLLLLFLSFVPVLTAPTTQTVITLAAGTITGLEISPNLFKFLGIPYAQPPTGNARFASPVAFPSAGLSPCVLFGCHSNRSINATAFGNICPQIAGGAEDCLSLNVFTTTVSPLALRPVMFW